MEAARVDICYRPLRSAFAIHSEDKNFFRAAVRTCHALRGGRYNPIVLVDRPNAVQIAKAFRVDMIVPMGSRPEVQGFHKENFPHLVTPTYSREIFSDLKNDPRCHLLDMHNTLLHWHGKDNWKMITDTGVRTFGWSADDPLADVFLMQLGAFPDMKDCGFDYADLLQKVAIPHPVLHLTIDKSQPLSPDIINHPSIGFLNVWGINPHYLSRRGWEYPGFYVGDAGNIDDLINLWNLRAADQFVTFLDMAHLARYEHVRPMYEEKFRAELAGQGDHHSKIGVWCRVEITDQAMKLFPDGGMNICRMADGIWDGGAIRPRMMILGEESSLGVLGKTVDGGPSVTFALKDKPFYTDAWFHTQHLAASISLSGAVRPGEQYTFQPPFVPELNQFYSRAMHFDPYVIRSEPDRVAVTIDVADTDVSLDALPAKGLIEAIFDSVGLVAKLSPAGLIARQLMARLGGADGARAFKIAGVRQLIKAHGPTKSFSKNVALQMIGKCDPGHGYRTFAEHAGLFIESRPVNTKLTPAHVFEHLVAKGLFRIGVDLVCPTCQLSGWIPLDQLQQSNICEYCGEQFDATRQLVNSEYHYRRTGVLGLERNAHGAIPVILLLQQMSVNLHAIRGMGFYLPSYELTPKPGVDLPKCETDFLILLPSGGRRKTQIIIGECKDAGGAIDADDIAKLGKIADAFPRDSYEVFILFAKLGAFSTEEVALAKSLNGQWQNRVILVTHVELEPYHTYELREAELKDRQYASSPEQMANNTRQLYFIAPQENSGGTPPLQQPL